MGGCGCGGRYYSQAITSSICDPTNGQSYRTFQDREDLPNIGSVEHVRASDSVDASSTLCTASAGKSETVLHNNAHAYLVPYSILDTILLFIRCCML